MEQKAIINGKAVDDRGLDLAPSTDAQTSALRISIYNNPFASKLRSTQRGIYVSPSAKLYRANQTRRSPSSPIP